MTSDHTSAKDFRTRGHMRRRKPLRAQISDVRTRLTDLDGRGISFQLDLLTLYAKSQQGAALALPVIGVIVASSSLLWLPFHQAIIWLSAVFVSHGIAISFCQKFDDLTPSQVVVDDWVRKFAIIELICSLTWSSLIFAFWGEAQQVERVYLIAVLMIVASIRMALANNVLAVVLAGTIPITLAVTLRCLLDGGTLFLSLAVMAICAEIYFIQLSRRLNETALHMLVFRAEKDALIGELEEAKSKSDEGRRRAEDANVAKSRFLATMSHELRTPLNAILGFSEVMKEEILGSHSVASYKDYAGHIHHSGQHLLNLISEVLDLSRIEAGRYELNESAVAIDRVAEECHALLDLRAKDQGITLLREFDPDVPMVMADERAIRQIWLNLMSNAIKFTPAGGTITLSLSQTETGGVVFSVRDTGPGIPTEEIPQVLSSFGQGSLAQQKAETGAGLGLPIVQGLARLHGGWFRLESVVGAGTTAIVELPRARVLNDQGEPMHPILRRSA